MAESWTCPFCPLRCDDLAWPSDGGLPSAAALDCTLAAEGVKRADFSGSPPLLDGRPVAWEQAIARAAEMLAEAPFVLIRGAMPDVATARAAVRLAQRFDGAVMCNETESLAALRQAVARDGVITATLGEVRRHADVVILVGDVLDALPRFAARFLRDSAALGGDKPDGPNIKRNVWLDTGAGSGAPSRSSAGRGAVQQDDTEAASPLLRIEVPAMRLERWLAAVRLQLRGGALLDTGDGAAIGRLVALLREAAYVAVVVSPQGIDGGGGETVAAALLGLVDDLNRQRRAVLISPDPAATFRHVASWTAGFGGPHQWSDQVPRPAAAQQLAQLADGPGAVTVDLEIGLAAPSAAGPGGAAVRIRRQAAVAEPPAGEVYLPVGTPGMDSAGLTVRGDGSVTLPLRKVRQTELRQAAELLSEIGGPPR